MTIDQVAAALAEGKRMRRPGWQRFVHIRKMNKYGDAISMQMNVGTDHWMPSIRDLQATDWQEAEEQQ